MISSSRLARRLSSRGASGTLLTARDARNVMSMMGSPSRMTSAASRLEKTTSYQRLGWSGLCKVKKENFDFLVVDWFLKPIDLSRELNFAF